MSKNTGDIISKDTNQTNTSDKITAVYGSPKIDGIIDKCWDKAEIIIPRIYGTSSDVVAEHRIMWDENALYILSVIKNSSLDSTNATSHQQDSVEYFLDERYDKGIAYKSDDLHYRVNCDNVRSYDAGEKTRFYSKTSHHTAASQDKSGYIVEACIVWSKGVTPVSGMELGFELSINVAQNGKRVTTISVFDSTGNAFQNPSLFGKLVLTGKNEKRKAKPNPYVLLSYIDSVKTLYLDAYVNKDIIKTPLAEAERAAASEASSQEDLDAAYLALRTAVDCLDDGSGFIKASALQEITDLPDAFTFLNGSRVSSLKDWQLRKEEISRLYQYYMYGVVPEGSGESIDTEYTDSYTMKNWWGQEMKITSQSDRQLVKIKVSKAGKTVSFIAIINYPSKTKTDETTGEKVITKLPPVHKDGYPVLIMIGFLGTKEKEYLSSQGYAVIEFNNTVIAAEAKSGTGIFYELYPYGRKWSEQTGVLLAWTWGVRKILDVLELDAAGAKELNISPTNTIVSGVSRNGKSAAIAGATDPRIKVTVPASSGEGGMACFRYVSAGKQYDYSMLEKHELTDQLGEEEGSAAWQKCQDEPVHIVGTNEALSNIQSAGHWFNDNFQGFSSPYQLPFDQHLLAALCADKDRYFITTGEIIGGDWINPAAMYVSYLAAQNIYDSLGLSDNIGIHLHAIGHALTLEDTKYLVEFCNSKFYGITDGNKDLSQLKTSIFEDERNYDSYFDIIKKAAKPVIL
jgi:endo-1,4-beta-xylanase